MVDYHPESRRPISNAFRRTAAREVRFCIQRGIHPNIISYLSIVVSSGAAVCFWQASSHPWLLVLGPLLCYIRLWFNMLDGMVALGSGTASRRGEIVNDLPDRISDLLIFAGVANSGLVHPAAAYWAALLALLTAYVGTLGQAVGARREFGGIMSKPWRMVTLHIGAWVTFAVTSWGMPHLQLAGWTILDWTCIIIVLGCVQTVAVRLSRTFRHLQQQGQTS